MSEELQQDVAPDVAGNAAEQGEQVEHQQGSEETTGQEAEQQTEEQKEQAQKKEPWFQKRIGELTRDKYEEKRVNADLKAENERLRMALAQGQQGEPHQEGEQGDVRTLARQEAKRMRAEERFTETCNRTYDAGKAEFPDFDRAVANLQMVGASREFLELATTSDAGHKLLHHLGTDMDEAARIMSLPPIQMARELTKLEFKLGQPATKPVSKAPAPIKPLGSGKAAGEGLSDDLPIDEWMRRHNQRK